MPQMQRMLYRDSAEAGEKRTNEERGEAESKSESKAIISSLNSIELSEKRFRRQETVSFAAHGCPKCRSVTGPDAHHSYVCGEKLPRAKQKQETEKEKKQHE